MADGPADDATLSDAELVRVLRRAAEAYVADGAGPRLVRLLRLAAARVEALARRQEAEA
jgi:hypothetical protein